MRAVYKLLLVLVVALACAVPAFPDAVQTTHVYDLTAGTYADSMGTGPSLVGYGGALSSTGYSFAANQGLSLTGAVNATNYSIEMVFSVNSIPSASWIKLVDFKNLTSDRGEYLKSGSPYLYNIGGTSAVVAPNTPTNLIITRDGATNLYSVYLNGALVQSFVDTTGLTVFSNNIAYFLKDDNVTGGRESMAGNISLIRTYNGALTQEQVTFVDDGGGVLGEVPEPASLLLFGSGLGSLVLIIRRKR